MLDLFLIHSDEDAINIIKKDHETVKALFEAFKKAKTLREKKPIVEKAIMELKIHADIEEQIFYRAVRPQLKTAMMNGADEEHHVAKFLIAELDKMNGSEDHYEAKFTVLSENIEHHVREEERDMLPAARKLDLDFVAIGRSMLARKAFLKTHGIPISAEEKMISRYGARDDSPAQAAKRNPKRSIKSKTAKKRKTVVLSLKRKAIAKSRKLGSILKTNKKSVKLKHA